MFFWLHTVSKIRSAIFGHHKLTPTYFSRFIFTPLNFQSSPNSRSLCSWTWTLAAFSRLLILTFALFSGSLLPPQPTQTLSTTMIPAPGSLPVILRGKVTLWNPHSPPLVSTLLCFVVVYLCVLTSEVISLQGTDWTTRRCSVTGTTIIGWVPTMCERSFTYNDFTTYH